MNASAGCSGHEMGGAIALSLGAHGVGVLPATGDSKPPLGMENWVSCEKEVGARERRRKGLVGGMVRHYWRVWVLRNK